MTVRSITRDLSEIEVAMDSWTEPFWLAAAEGRLVVPRCVGCGHVRWPPGPFCPECRSQETEWIPASGGRIYSFTVLPVPGLAPEAAPAFHVPTLVRFADAGNVILLGSLIDAPLDAISIDADVEVDWIPTANGRAPAFRLVQPGSKA